MSAAALIENGWFLEKNEQWPGQAMALEVEEVLEEATSPFQHVLAFRSKTYGNVLVLDGVIQATERDEFSYQEMIAHIPLNAHPNPRHVLVIGGGDGGVLREVVKHESVEQVTLCEIDEKVIEFSRKYLPEMAKGFDHPKVKLHIGDGFAYLREKENSFDVIITDSSDPVGPAEALFGKPFFELLNRALKAEGLICTQAECQWLHLPLVKNILTNVATFFPTVSYAFTTIPTYPSGQIGFLVASKTKDDNLKVPKRTVSPDEENIRYKYYNSEVHTAAFVLPQFTRKALFLS